MGFSGMDVGEIEGLADRLELQAKAMEVIVGVVDAAVSGLMGVWHGADLDHFAGSWHQSHRPRTQTMADQLAGWVATLRAQAQEQDRASGGNYAGGRSGHPFGNLNPGWHVPSWMVPMVRVGPVLPGVLPWISPFPLGSKDPQDWVDAGRDYFDRLSVDKDLIETVKGHGYSIFDDLPHGSYYDAGAKGIGLGLALGDFVNATQGHDRAGQLGAVADGGFTFASAPFSLLWTGLKTETSFFIPSDPATQDAHQQWMQDRGYTPDQISTRYDNGFQGFIDYGNDEVERKAPWMNDIADKVTAAPAEWLYNIGIKL